MIAAIVSWETFWSVVGACYVVLLAAFAWFVWDCWRFGKKYDKDRGTD